MATTGFMVRPKTAQRRRVTYQRWGVTRWDPQTGEKSVYELTCVAGNFFASYRMLGLVDDGLSSDQPTIELFDPYTGAWARTKLEEWTEVLIIQS